MTGTRRRHHRRASAAGAAGSKRLELRVNDTIVGRLEFGPRDAGAWLFEAVLYAVGAGQYHVLIKGYRQDQVACVRTTALAAEADAETLLSVQATAAGKGDTVSALMFFGEKMAHTALE